MFDYVEPPPPCENVGGKWYFGVENIARAKEVLVSADASDDGDTEMYEGLDMDDFVDLFDWDDERVEHVHVG